jgi:hypothetical protein
MIQVAMGDEDLIQSSESNTRSQNLSLGSFAAINQKPLVTMGNDLAR